MQFTAMNPTSYRTLLRSITGFAVGLAVVGSGFAQVAPEKAVESLDIGEGLEATLFASEPLLLSPSSIDIDHLGRVWVCEIVNYRWHNGKRPEGDRILVLEDSDGDGKADKKTVFYQGRDIDSPHGNRVLGNKAIVMAAVSQNGLVLEHASVEMKGRSWLQ